MEEFWGGHAFVFIFARRAGGCAVCIDHSREGRRRKRGRESESGLGPGPSASVWSVPGVWCLVQFRSTKGKYRKIEACILTLNNTVFVLLHRPSSSLSPPSPLLSNYDSYTLDFHPLQSHGHTIHFSFFINLCFHPLHTIGIIIPLIDNIITTHHHPCVT